MRLPCAGERGRIPALYRSDPGCDERVVDLTTISPPRYLLPLPSIPPALRNGVTEYSAASATSAPVSGLRVSLLCHAGFREITVAGRDLRVHSPTLFESPAADGCKRYRAIAPEYESHDLCRAICATVTALARFQIRIGATARRQSSPRVMRLFSRYNEAQRYIKTIIPYDYKWEPINGNWLIIRGYAKRQAIRSDKFRWCNSLLTFCAPFRYMRYSFFYCTQTNDNIL